MKGVVSSIALLGDVAATAAGSPAGSPAASRESAKKKRRQLPRKLKTTREGKALIGITLGIGAGAVNSGNNLLYLILGLLLSLIVVSGVLSEWTVRGVEVKRRYLGAFHAGREALLQVELRNTKPKARSYSLEIEELLVGGAEVAVGGARAVVQRSAYQLVLGPGEATSVPLRLTAKRRGRYESEGLKIATEFPFGFFRKWREVDAPTELWVWPALRQTRLPTSLSVGMLGAEPDPRRVGRGDEYHGLREHRYDDDPRDIHWKSAARLGRPMTREYEAPATRRIWLHLSTVAPASVDDAFEDAVTEVASLAAQLLAGGYSVGLATNHGTVMPAPGAGHLPELLDHLARVERREPGKPGATLEPAGQPGDRLLVCYPGMTESAGGFEMVVQATAVPT